MAVTRLEANRDTSLREHVQRRATIRRSFMRALQRARRTHQDRKDNTNTEKNTGKNTERKSRKKTKKPSRPVTPPPSRRSNCPQRKRQYVHQPRNTSQKKHVRVTVRTHVTEGGATTGGRKGAKRAVRPLEKRRLCATMWCDSRFTRACACRACVE